ncbi:MAG TPA: DUF1810 domain-containing protein [Luteimonas sp.]|nr:DUF1810 domain-containing protein [Luteimonas sp.]
MRLKPNNSTSRHRFAVQLSGVRPHARHLEWFVEAQDPIYNSVIEEIRTGKKRTHWMWFVFPQLLGLGRSEMANRFGLSGLDEAREYLAHEILGPRLAECTEAVLHGEVSPDLIFGPTDFRKFVSSMTLFRAAAGENSLFARTIAQISETDEVTLALLGKSDV